MRHLAVWLAAALVGALAVGCSSEDEPSGGAGGGTGKLSIEAFDATPSTITPGGETILSWKTLNATSIRIYDDRNEVRAQSLKNEDSVTLQLTETTNFKLIAQNAVGESAERFVKVTVQEETGPQVTFAANTNRMDYESSAVLNWDVKEAVRVVITAVGGDVLVDTDSSADRGKFTGSQPVHPDRTTIYELEATPEEGQPTKKPAKIIVDPVISQFAPTTLEKPVPAGTEVELSWKTKGAESLTITTPEGLVHEVPEGSRSSGSVFLPVGASGLFTLTATRGEGEKTKETRIGLQDYPEIISLSATPDAINAGQPSTVTLSWKIAGADKIRIVADGGVPVMAPVENPPPEGTYDVTQVVATTTYSLIASNDAGDSTREVTVQAVARPEILSFSATPDRVVSAQTVRLTWQTKDSSELVLTKEDGLVTTLPIEQDDDGFIEHTVIAQSTFTLTARNLAGAEVTESVVVTIGPPVIDSFTVGARRHSKTDHILLSWSGHGGTTAKVNQITRTALGAIDTSIEVCSYSFPKNVAVAECDVGARSTFGRYEFQLQIQDAAATPNKAEKFVTALVSDGPVIDIFAVSPPTINVGESTNVTWNVLPDATGRPPELTLSNADGPLELEELETDPTQGRVLLQFDSPGLHRLTLSASSGGGATFADTATVTVEVLAFPEISSFTANPTAIEDGEPVTLSWSLKSTYSATLYEVIGGTPRAIYTLGSGELRRGSRRITPPSGHTSISYRLIARNAKGKEAEQDVRVTIGNFSLIAPSTAFAGSTITISWDAPAPVTIAPVYGPPVEVTTTSLFEDISATGEELTMVACGADPNGLGVADEGCGQIEFPPDFLFPFGGYEQAALEAYVNGLLSFNVGAFPGYTSNSGEAFPTNPIAYYASLAPLWSNFDLGPNGGEVFYERRQDAAGDRMIVQWSDAFSKGGSSGRTSSFTFQAVLWADGAVDFRYGTIQDDVAALTKGGSATIGYQLPSGSKSHSMGPQAASLQNRSWRYLRGSHPASGSASFTVDETTIFTICVEGPAGPECRQRTVTVL